MFSAYWEKKNPDSFTSFFTARFTLVSSRSFFADYMTALASGLVAGAGLMGVVNAVFSLTNVPTLVNPDAGT